MGERLTRNDWIAFGLQELKDSGFKALNAQSLAKKMNVSRGSFYWHFKDIKDFKTEVIRAWRLKSTETIIAAVSLASTPRERLELLIKETLRAPTLELSVRAWAAESEFVAKSAAEIDQQRYSFVESLLREIGVDERDLKVRSLVLYWAAIGRTVVDAKNFQQMDDEEIIKLADLMSR